MKKTIVAFLCLAVCYLASAKTNYPEGSTPIGVDQSALGDNQFAIGKQGIQIWPIGQTPPQPKEQSNTVSAASNDSTSNTAAKDPAQPSNPALPDISKLKKWKDVIKNPEFLALSEDEKQEVRDRYFNLLAPYAAANGDNVDALRAELMAIPIPETPWYQRIEMQVVDHWKYIAIGIAALLAIAFRKKVALTGRYIIDNAYKIAALSASIVLLAYAVKIVKWMI